MANIRVGIRLNGSTIVELGSYLESGKYLKDFQIPDLAKIRFESMGRERFVSTRMTIGSYEHLLKTLRNP